jgi:hypothetical protein
MKSRALTRVREVACGRSAVRDGMTLAIIVTALAVCSVSVASGTDAAGADTSTSDCAAAE